MALKRLGGFKNLFLVVAFTMGNKQTVFTDEQLEAYQVGVMGGALSGFDHLGFLA